MKAAIISVGNEILLGRTVNTNQSWLSAQLAAMGITTGEVRVIADHEDDIRRTFTNLLETYPLVISTGGLGPTTDDITKKTVAGLFNCTLEFIPSIWEHVQSMFARRGITVSPINRCQAEVPKGFNALQNDQGTAPGLHYHTGKSHLFLLPGVPHETKHLFSSQIVPILKNAFSLPIIRQHDLHTEGIAESRLAELLQDFRVPTGLELAYLPQPGRVDLRLYGPASNDFAPTIEELKRLVAPYLWAENCPSPAYALHNLLINNKLTMSLAESCTGGLASQLLTAQPGASRYLTGALVSYSYEAKNQVLGVKKETLDKHGQVSEATAVEMAQKCLALFNTDYSIAITGIAGPDGGSDEKPVGIVFMAVAARIGVAVKRYTLNGVRNIVQIQAAEKALLLAYRTIKQEMNGCGGQ